MGISSAARGGRVRAAAFLFFLFSFLGWGLEKFWFFIAYGVNEPRGFLTLPFCPIYGFSLLAIRALLGEPFRRGLAYPWNALFFLGYALLAALIASAAELATGLLFEHAFGERLWLYSYCQYNLLGYICLPASVGWGFLIPVALQAVWFPLERLLAPRRWVGYVSAVLAVMLAADFFLTAFL